MRLEPGARNDLTSATVALVAEELGVKRRTAFARLSLADTLADAPELAADGARAAHRRLSPGDRF